MIWMQTVQWKKCSYMNWNGGRGHLSRKENEGRITRKKRESKKTSERNYKVNMKQPQGKPKNILIFRFNDQTSKPADTLKPPQHSFMFCYYCCCCCCMLSIENTLSMTSFAFFRFISCYFYLFSSNVNANSERKLFVPRGNQTQMRKFQLLCNIFFIFQLKLSFPRKRHKFCILTFLWMEKGFGRLTVKLYLKPNTRPLTPSIDFILRKHTNTLKFTLKTRMQMNGKVMTSHKRWARDEMDLREWNKWGAKKCDRTN